LDRRPRNQVRLGRSRLRRRVSPALEAFPAEHRAPLRGPEGHRRFAAALRAVRGRFHARVSPRASGSLALLLTRPAALGFVLEILIVEEGLLSRGEDEICPAVDALEGSVLKIWHRLAPAGPFLGLRSPHGFKGRLDGPALGVPLGVLQPGYSGSRRVFFRFRLRASACFTRFFSPGFR
jgi:hypothetical protein